MSATVTRLNKPMTKDELIRHLERDHSQAVTVKIIAKQWTKVELADTHRIIHLGLGR
jgi:hypothetical protein